tara:strand:+ start:170 stop:295 length:126 start_codon:yes stop_codon:yes gene_type:complete
MGARLATATGLATKKYVYVQCFPGGIFRGIGENSGIVVRIL